MYKKRTYKDFSRKQIAAIATEYATSYFGKSEAYFTQEYNISSDTFYSILHNAISKRMVSKDIAEKIRDKACTNSRTVAGTSASVRSFNTYRILFDKRSSFKFKKNEAIKYSKKFAKSDLSLDAFCISFAIPEDLMLQTIADVFKEKWVGEDVIELIEDKLATFFAIRFAHNKLSQKDFCRAHKPLTVKTLGNLLKRAVIHNLVSDDIVIKLRNNALTRHDCDRVYDFFAYLEAERNLFKNGSDEAL